MLPSRRSIAAREVSSASRRQGFECSALQQRTPAMARPPAPAVRFSDDTARLEKMHAVRNSSVGSQIKAVIELVYRGRVRRLNDDMDNAYDKETMESTPSALCVTLTRKALAAKQINEATYVVIAGNNAVFESPWSNPKTPSMRNGISGVKDGRCLFCYKPTHVVTGKDELLALIRRFCDGIKVNEVEDAYPSVLNDLQVAKLSMVKAV
ncbi:hypothetical protein ACQ4PT_027704 [Festuca glaucescens]